MAKTYNTFTNVATGDVLTATNFNNLLTNTANYRVPPMCRLQGESGQSLLNSTTTTLNFPDANEVYDTDGMHSSVNATRITPTTAGVYLVTASFYMSGASTTRLFLGIQKNGSTVESHDVTAGLGLNNSTVLTANGTTDYFTVVAFQTSGGTLTINNSFTFFTATWLGQTS
jgi:hypothetical protein